MLCPKCGSPVGETASLCQNCQTSIADLESNTQDTNDSPQGKSTSRTATGSYILFDDESPITVAGSIARILAFVVDTVAVYLFLSMIVLILVSIDLELPKSLVKMFSLTVLSFDIGHLSEIPFTKDMARDIATFILLMLFAGWFYYPPFESSILRGTPGKLLFGLRVWSTTGNRLTFSQASSRHFTKLLSLIPLGMGFFIAFFHQRGQALHDLIPHCMIVRVSRLSIARLIFALSFSTLFCGIVIYIQSFSSEMLAEKIKQHDPQSVSHLADYINYREQQKKKAEKEKKFTTGSPVNGKLRGKNFELDKANYAASTLELRMGKGFFPKLGLKIFLPLSKNRTPENQLFNYSRDSRQNFPAITVSWLPSGARVPNHDNFGNHRRYDMTLEFGKRVGNVVNGKIKLKLPDDWNSEIAGVFTATISN